MTDKKRQKSSKNSSSSPRKKFADLIRKVDASDLKADFDQWPSLANRAWCQTAPPKIEQPSEGFDRIAFAGMGGSGISGELLIDLSRETKSPTSFETLKDYHLPDYFDNSCLVVGMSSSGGTEETLSVLSEAHRKGLVGLAIGSGGLLEHRAKSKWNFPFVKSTMLKVPRSSLPGIFYPALKALSYNKLLLVEESEVDESIHALEQVKLLVQDPDHQRNPALDLALSLASKGNIPLLYSSFRTRAVALRARQSINENAKLHGFDGEIPELCHNDIVGWDSKKTRVTKAARDQPGCAVLLRLEEDDPEEIETRFDIVRDVIKKSGGESYTPTYRGESYLARIISMLYFLDYVSYYMAIIRGIDPIKTPSIQLLKRQLAHRLNYIERL